MKIAWLSDQYLVTNPQCYKDRQSRSSLLSISMSQRDISIIKTNASNACTTHELQSIDERKHMQAHVLNYVYAS